MPSYKVLVIDDDRLMRTSLVDLIEAAGWVAKALVRATEATRWIAQFQPDVILSDVRMPEMTGLELLDSLTGGPPVVLISAHGDIPMAVEAMNAGAYSFVEKPFDPKRLLTILAHASEQHKMRLSNDRLRARLRELSGLDRILIGQTPQMQTLRQAIAQIAESAAPVLIHGETGTGKDLVARALHDISGRCDGPFLAVNAAQFDIEQLPLIVRNAEGGTLFLDEICACPLDVQPGLLRLIEAREMLFPGAGRPERVDVRILSATNEDTQRAVTEGRLRQDLLFRLDTFGLDLPPLRTRIDDIPLLMKRFLDDLCAVYEIGRPDLTDADLSAMMAHDWPGNVRELRNLAERFAIGLRHGALSIVDVMHAGAPPGQDRPGLREAVAAFERQLIGRAIAEQEGRMDEVAEHLGIGRRTLNEKIVKLGLDKDAYL